MAAGATWQPPPHSHFFHPLQFPVPPIDMARFHDYGQVVEAYAKVGKSKGRRWARGEAWIEASTAHGVRRAGWAVHWWARVFWLAAFAAGFGSFIFLAITLVAVIFPYF